MEKKDLFWSTVCWDKKDSIELIVEMIVVGVEEVRIWVARSEALFWASMA